jgi:hypothetical protein
MLLQARPYWEIMLMLMYWSLKSIPELSGLPSEERRRVWWAAYLKITRHWQFWASLVGVFFLCVQIGDMLIGHRIGGPIGAVVSGFILRQVSCTWRVHIFEPFSQPSRREAPRAYLIG